MCSDLQRRLDYETGAAALAVGVSKAECDSLNPKPPKNGTAQIEKRTKMPTKVPLPKAPCQSPAEFSGPKAVKLSSSIPRALIGLGFRV